MVKILMVLASFFGVVGNATNERRIALSIVKHNEVEKIFVLNVSSMIEILHTKNFAKKLKKMKVLTLPRLPSPHPTIFMLQMIIYGFLLALFSIFLKISRIIDTIYVRESWLAFGFISLKRFLEPVAVKIVSIATDESFFVNSKTHRRGLIERIGYMIETYVIKNTNILFTVPGFSERITEIRGHYKGIIELHQPIPIEFFSQSQPIFSSNSGYLVGYVGLISPIHSVDVIVRAMSLVQGDIPNARLLITGDGDPRYVSYIIELMNELKVKGSLMLRVSESEMPRIYKSLHLLVIPRSKLLEDVLPMKFIEATIANVPIIATKTKALYQLLTGSGLEDAVFVDDNDPHNWAYKIKALLINDDLRLHVAEVLSKYLKHYVESHRPETVAEKFINSIKRCYD